MFYLKQFITFVFVKVRLSMSKIVYTPLNLPKSLVDELKVWRLAFCTVYGRTVSYGEMIRSMLDCMEDYEPVVVSELGRILEKHPVLDDKMIVYRNTSYFESEG